MPREFARHQRLGTQILRTLSELLRFESKDPRTEGVSLVSVDLSRDLGVAKVYFSMVDPEASPELAQEGLEKASGFLRSRLGRQIKVRHIPELRFIHDDSVEHGMKISELIDGALGDD